jgi:hypothetical protein
VGFILIENTCFSKTPYFTPQPSANELIFNEFEITVAYYTVKVHHKWS